MIASIYKLASNQTSLVYIGSTTQKINRRLSGHKTDYTRFMNGTRKDSCSSFSILQFGGDINISLLEEVPLSLRLEREKYWIQQDGDNCVNVRVPTRTSKQHYEDNKTSILARHKIYKDGKKDIIKQENKDYYERQGKYLKLKPWTCDVCNKTMAIGTKPRHERTRRHLSKNLTHEIILVD